MGFPDWIAPEDMPMYTKEWTLCGHDVRVTGSEMPESWDVPNSYEEVHENHGGFGDFSYVRGGTQKYWIKVPVFTEHAEIEPDEALKIAESYVIPR